MAPHVVPVWDGEANAVSNSEVETNAGRTHETVRPASESETRNLVVCDVLVVGAGFSGISAIHRLRKTGLSVKAFEAGSEFGGTWNWNRYPGARVDCEIPLYQLDIPEIYNNYNFPEKFPSGVHLRKYINFIEKRLDLRKDVYLNARVNDATWDAAANRWNVATVQGHRASCRYLLLCAGALNRTYTPDFKGLKNYKGLLCHSGAYPEGLSLKGKKAIVVGSGATAVQIIQEVGKEAERLSVLVRRPTYAYPMRQRPLTDEEQKDLKFYLPAMMAHSRQTRGGFHDIPPTVNTFDVDDETRQAIFEKAWAIGGLHVFNLGFADSLLDEKANRAFYEFWKSKIRLRLTDPKKQSIMCPDEPPYLINTKRPPLEQDYYEVLNQSNVDIVNLSKNAIASFNEDGIVLEDGTSIDADVVILATGFDSFTGSITHMGLKNKDGVPLKDLWADRISMYLALTISGFPNMFVCYTPQSPAAFSNGTTMIESQVETIIDMILKAEKENIKTVEAKQAAADKWADAIEQHASHTLLPKTDSWWNRSNMPGSKKQQLIYLGGLKTYIDECHAAIDGWQGFDVVSHKSKAMLV